MPKTFLLTGSYKKYLNVKSLRKSIKELSRKERTKLARQFFDSHQYLLKQRDEEIRQIEIKYSVPLALLIRRVFCLK